MKTEKNKASEVIINDLTIVSPDRGRKDIGGLKNAVIQAESVYFPNRVLLYDLYHDILSMDAFLRGLLKKRIDTVLNKPLKFIDASGKEDKDLTELMSGTVGRNLITELMNSQFWGISGVEFIVGQEFCFKKIPRKHIKPEKGLITKNQYGVTEADGFSYKDLPMVWVIGEEDDLGLLLACSMYAIYKRGNFGDWAQYVEIFGQPVRIIYYDAYDTKTKNELNQILNESGSSLAMMIPKQAEFEMMDGKTSNGDGKLQESFKDACNSEMAICILGNTETTSSSKSSGYAQAVEHADQQDEISASDLVFVENKLNSKEFIQILKSYGYKTQGGKYCYDQILNLNKLKTRMEIDVVVSGKVPVSDDYWYDTYGLPKPDNYDQLKKEQLELINNATEIKPVIKEDKKSSKTSELTDYSKSNILENLFKNLSDFFDQARH
ncbi:DUF935 family protein [Flavobacterium sp. '19STA2R22 D10 B1']|uniref:phage portal protein family protein n=1 Tax=Flavobacterium aerium TaxID=3037261 RepID=UPI00278C73C3|nr:DUF935 family protein [Flavobacterium sp. '19STA2R22 D10 B1']